MLKTGFYFVNKNYIEYLKNVEIEARGYTTVPNVVYANRNKYLYGSVLKIYDLYYYVPVSSYTKDQQDNYLIRIKDHHKTVVKGSLRFNYMIPVPEKCLEWFAFATAEIDQNRRILIEKEYRFCKSAHAAIVKKAEKTYNRVIEAKDEVLNKNSCDFKLLEEACLRYEAEML